MWSGKGQIYYIFACTAGGRTPDASKLSNCIEQVTIAKMKENNGVLNCLDVRQLRYHINETEATDLT